jgi:endonuclease YncB( thermonuclease family)
MHVKGYIVRNMFIFVGLGLFALTGPASGKEVLSGPIHADLIEIIDGDTLKARATIWLGQEVVINVRIAGIDTPEKGGRAKCTTEKTRGEKATAFLAEFVGEGPITLTNVQYGKYAGRVMADVANGDREDAGTALIESGFARIYRGGKRARWCP